MKTSHRLGVFAAAALAALFALPLSAASVDGMDIHSSSAGAGPTIVFVHGWTCDSSSWAGQVPAFAKDHRVITLDLPGHGRSESPQDGKLSMDVFARAVEAVRAEANAERIVLVGHSMGAPVIRQYAHTVSPARRRARRRRWAARSCARSASCRRAFRRR